MLIDVFVSTYKKDVYIMLNTLMYHGPIKKLNKKKKSLCMHWLWSQADGFIRQYIYTCSKNLSGLY